MNNNSNPLMPQGSLLEQKATGRARVKLAVFFVLAIHLVLLGALLMQGCKREEPPQQAPAPETNDVTLPPLDLPPVIPDDTNAAVEPQTNYPSIPQGPYATQPASNNLPVPPPFDPVPAPPVTSQTATEYTIAQGDTFYGIAKKLGVSMNAIVNANPGVDPARLKVGQKINIPASTGTAAPTSTGAAPSGNGETIHTVKSGESLTKIAARYGTTVKAIQNANNLRTVNIIKVGQKLKIPSNSKAAAPAPAPAAEAAPYYPPVEVPPYTAPTGATTLPQ